MIGIISDIHGNYPALQSVIRKLEKENCQQIISLGDIAGYYCMINECIELCEKKNIINILGNHDYYLVKNVPCPRSYSANMCLDYQRKAISKKNMTWLSKSIDSIDTEKYSMRHGGWNNVLDEYVEQFDFLKFDQMSQKIFISGHTHIQTMQKYQDKIYFNPGAVGQPRDYIVQAAYATIDEEFNVNLCHVEYNIDEIASEMRKNGFKERISSCLYYGVKIGEEEKERL